MHQTNIYRVIITNPGAVAPNNGFLSDLNLPKLIENLDELPTSDLTSIAVTRGYIRYNWMIDSLKNLTVFKFIRATQIRTDINTDPTTLTFEFEVVNNEYLRTEDELNPNTFLQNELAITRAVARALIRGGTVKNIWYPVDPVLGIYRLGGRFDDIQVGPAFPTLITAEAQITTTLLANGTL